MKIIRWIKKRCQSEQYVYNVKMAEKDGLTYIPELYKDCTMRPLPRYLNKKDIHMAGGWRDK